MPKTTKKTDKSHKKIWRYLLWAVLGFFALIIFVVLNFYAVALWYQRSQSDIPYKQGVTFIPSYAEYLGVDPQKTMDAIIEDLGVDQLRLTSYWNEIEPRPGEYDFTKLDWQMKKAEAAGADVSLAIGLRQPRWPECHAPAWIDTSKPVDQWQPALEKYITAVVERYKDSPSLVSYQLENEFFNNFGECNNFDRARLQSELNLVKKLDPNHPVIISRSNNYAGVPIRQPLPDIHGISIYRKVYSPWVRGYYTYPFPSWYYAGLAGIQQITTGKPSIIHELQAEPWPAQSGGILKASLEEQNKTFDAEQMHANARFARQTGIRHIDYWGAEYWYYRKMILKDPSVWEAAKEELHAAPRAD